MFDQAEIARFLLLILRKVSSGDLPFQSVFSCYIADMKYIAPTLLFYSKDDPFKYLLLQVKRLECMGRVYHVFCMKAFQAMIIYARLRLLLSHGLNSANATQYIKFMKCSFRGESTTRL